MATLEAVLRTIEHRVQGALVVLRAQPNESDLALTARLLEQAAAECRLTASQIGDHAAAR